MREQEKVDCEKRSFHIVNEVLTKSNSTKENRDFELSRKSSMNSFASILSRMQSIEDDEKNLYMNTQERRNSMSSLFSTSLFEGNIDHEYENVVEERHLRCQAKMYSIRYSAIMTFAMLGFYVGIGVMYYSYLDGDWAIEQSLLFIVYTMTTVGYGNIQVVTSPRSKLFTTVYIFFGIGIITLFASGLIEYIVLEGVQTQYRRDRVTIARKGMESLQNNATPIGKEAHQSMQVYLDDAIVDRYGIDFFIQIWRKVKNFSRRTNIGICLADSIPLLVIIFTGAVTVGSLEGWSVIDSIYFSVVSCTTVGYGDIFPSKKSSIWVTIFWLPLSLYFMSQFVSSLNRLYRSINEKHTDKIYARLKKMKEFEDSNQMNETSCDEESSEPTAICSHKNLSISEYLYHTKSQMHQNRVMRTQKGALHDKIPQDCSKDSNERPIHTSSTESQETKSTVHDENVEIAVTPRKDTKASSYLRLLVQERIAQIIQYEILLRENSVISSSQRKKYDTITVHFLEMKEVAEKWLIPLRARESFAVVTMDLLITFGKDGLRRGQLFDQPHTRFQRIFMPVMAAMEPLTILETWLASTEMLITNDLNWRN